MPTRWCLPDDLFALSILCFGEHLKVSYYRCFHFTDKDPGKA